MFWPGDPVLLVVLFKQDGCCVENGLFIRFVKAKIPFKATAGSGNAYHIEQSRSKIFIRIIPILLTSVDWTTNFHCNGTEDLLK